MLVYLGVANVLARELATARVVCSVIGQLQISQHNYYSQGNMSPTINWLIKKYWY